MPNVLAQTCPMTIKVNWLFYWCYNMTCSTCLLASGYSHAYFQEHHSVSVIYRFLFFEVKDIQYLSQQGFTYPKLKLGDYCRRTHYLLTVAEKATTLHCIGDKDIKMVDL